MNFRSLPHANDGIFLVIPHGVRNIWTKFELSSNLFRVLMDFGLILPVYRHNLRMGTFFFTCKSFAY